MEKNQIHRLLEKYFEGHTTLEEEMTLRSFFSLHGNENPEWNHLRRQFELLGSTDHMHMDSNKLSDLIVRKIQSYELQQAPSVRKLKAGRYMLAASIAIAAILSIFLIFRSQKSQITDTFSDPQLAYAETRKTLLFISGKINEGMKPLTNINKINSASEQLKNLEKMDKSMGMLNLVSFINQSSNLKK